MKKDTKYFEIRDAIDNYLKARIDIIKLGEKYPKEIGGNDNIIGRIGEYIGLRFLESHKQRPQKVESKSNKGFDFIDGKIFTQVKTITSENKLGRIVRLVKPWNQFLLIELSNEYVPERIGLLSQSEHEIALRENGNWSATPIVKRSMLSTKGLIGKYGQVYEKNDIHI